MQVEYSNFEKGLEPLGKVVKFNDKYYVELKGDSEDFMAELAISLASEVDNLRERIELLEERIRMYQRLSSTT